MGQLAEDILDGSCCELCGQYFKHSDEGGIHCHEKPVVCWDCWKDLTKEEKKSHQRAEVKTF